MSKIDEMFEKVRKEGYTIKELRDSVRYLKIGDEVLIPIELLSEYSKNDYPNGMKAVVVNVSKNHVTFRLPFGFNRTLLNSDCQNLKILQKSNFAAYDEKMLEKDVLDALKDRREKDE